MWFSAKQTKVWFLHTEKSVVICSQIRIWSSAHRQKCGHLLTYKSVATCHITLAVFYALTLVTIGSTKCSEKANNLLKLKVSANTKLYNLIYIIDIIYITNQFMRDLMYLAALPWVSLSTIRLSMHPAKYTDPKQLFLKIFLIFILIVILIFSYLRKPHFLVE